MRGEECVGLERIREGVGMGVEVVSGGERRRG